MSRLVTDSVEDFIAGRYRIVDEPADDLVTEEMIHVAAECLDYPSVYMGGPREQSKRTAARLLRAVAPMIAARAMDDDKIRDRVVVIAKRMVAAEREACARLAADMGRAWEADGIGDDGAAEAIAAAIRARGETP
jgi:hypothetical protein